MFELFATNQLEIGTVVLLDENPWTQDTSLVSADHGSDFFRSLMIEYNLVFINRESLCTRPVCTFQSHHGGPATGVDHITTNKAFVSRPKVARDRAPNKDTITDYSNAVSQNLWSVEYHSGQINELLIDKLQRSYQFYKNCREIET